VHEAIDCTWFPEAVRKRAKEFFERIFSKGEKVLVTPHIHDDARAGKSD
jgi:hypothetical protein